MERKMVASTCLNLSDFRWNVYSIYSRILTWARTWRGKWSLRRHRQVKTLTCLCGCMLVTRLSIIYWPKVWAAAEQWCKDADSSLCCLRLCLRNDQQLESLGEVSSHAQEQNVRLQSTSRTTRWCGTRVPSGTQGMSHLCRGQVMLGWLLIQ